MLFCALTENPMRLWCSNSSSLSASPFSLMPWKWSMSQTGMSVDDFEWHTTRYFGGFSVTETGSQSPSCSIHCNDPLGKNFSKNGRLSSCWVWQNAQSFATRDLHVMIFYSPLPSVRLFSLLLQIDCIVSVLHVTHVNKCHINSAFPPRHLCCVVYDWKVTCIEPFFYRL